MPVTCTEENRTLTASVSGDLDHHSATEIMEELSRQIDVALPRKMILDLSELTFTDSSGIAVVLRTFQKMRQIQGSLVVQRIPEQALRVFLAAGLDKMISLDAER